MAVMSAVTMMPSVPSSPAVNTQYFSPFCSADRERLEHYALQRHLTSNERPEPVWFHDPKTCAVGKAHSTTPVPIPFGPRPSVYIHHCTKRSAPVPTGHLSMYWGSKPVGRSRFQTLRKLPTRPLEDSCALNTKATTHSLQESRHQPPRMTRRGAYQDRGGFWC